LNREAYLTQVMLFLVEKVLESGSQDRHYLGQILQYSLDKLRKLSSPSKEDEMKKIHDKLLAELIEVPESDCRGPNSFVLSVIKGLRFTMEELKVLTILSLLLNKLMGYMVKLHFCLMTKIINEHRL